MKSVFSITLLFVISFVPLWAQPLLDNNWDSGSNLADEQTSGPVVFDLSRGGMCLHMPRHSERGAAGGSRK